MVRLSDHVAGGFAYATNLETGTPQIDSGPENYHFEQSGAIHVVATGFAADEDLTLGCACTVSRPTAHTDAAGASTFDVVVSGPRRAKDLALSITGALSTRSGGNVPFTLRPGTAAGVSEVGDLSSPNGVFSISTLNGGLVVYETSAGGGAPWWTNGLGLGGEAHLFIQSDGNLVLRDATGRALFQSRTVGAGPNLTLTMQDDGNLVLRSAKAKLCG